MKSLYSVVKNNLMVTKLFFLSDSISESGNKVLVLTRKIGSKPVTVNLEFKSDGLYVIPPKYTFRSSVSHCDYLVEEQRWTRRKDTIFCLVKALKKATVWSFIKNKEFFKINENCKTFSKMKSLKNNVQKQIFDVLNDDSKKKSRKEVKELDKQATQLLKKVG